MAIIAGKKGQKGMKTSKPGCNCGAREEGEWRNWEVPCTGKQPGDTTTIIENA